MKICKDCKYYKRYWLDQKLSRCMAPQSTTIHPVTGKPSYTFCDISREYTRYCGPNAIYYVGKNETIFRSTH
jgi:hypothetical protein